MPHVSKFVVLIWLLSAGLYRAQTTRTFGGNYTRFQIHKAFAPLTTSATILKTALNQLSADSVEATTGTTATIRQFGPGPPSICPGGFTVLLSFPHFKLLNEFPSAECQLHSGLRPSLGTLENSSSIFSDFFEALIGAKLGDYGSDVWTASISGTLLRCRGDPGGPFSNVSFIPLVDVILIHTHTIFAAHGLDRDVFKQVFSPNISSSSSGTEKWDFSFAKESRRAVGAILNNLTNANLMAVHRSAEDSSTQSGARSIPGIAPENVQLGGMLASIFSSVGAPCTFIGSGDMAPEALRAELKRLEMVLVPILAHFLAKKPAIPKHSMYPVDPLCNSSRALFDGLDSFEFPDSENMHVNGARCGPMSLQSYLEAEPLLKNGSSDMRMAQEVAGKIVQFQVRLDTNITALVNEARFVKQHPCLASGIQEAVIKSTIMVARLNFAACPDLLPSAATAAWVIFPRVSTRELFCQNFSILPLGLKYHCPPNGTASINAPKTTLYEFPAFVVRRNDSVSNANHSLPSACLFSSNVTVASALRAAIIAKRPAHSNVATVSHPPNSPSPMASVLPSQVIPLPEGIVVVNFSSSASPSSSISATGSISVSPTGSSPAGGGAIGPRSANTNTTKTAACFPAGAKVLLRDGRSVRMERLQIGDEPHIGGGLFSTIILFTHANPYVTSSMIILRGHRWNVMLSKNHILPVNGTLSPAMYVKPGDRVVVGTTEEIVEQVSFTTARGLYNPHTTSGTLMVGFGTGKPVLVSTYTTKVMPAAAHALLAPLRVIYFATGYTLDFLSQVFPDTYNTSNYENSVTAESIRARLFYYCHMKAATIVV